MPSFHIEMRTDVASATTTIIADSAYDALDKVRATPQYEFDFDPILERRPVNEILVRQGYGLELIWRDPDLTLRRSAEDLLITAKNLLTALQLYRVRVPRFLFPILAMSLDHLQVAVDQAEGRIA